MCGAPPWLHKVVGISTMGTHNAGERLGANELGVYAF
jgi:hypothetical protein